MLIFAFVVRICTRKFSLIKANVLDDNASTLCDISDEYFYFILFIHYLKRTAHLAAVARH